MKKRDSLIKNIYLYLVTFVGIVISVIGSITLIDLGLKAYVFTSADTYINYPRPMIEKGELIEVNSDEKQEEYHQKELSSRRQRQAANAIAMLVVGFPLYYYHWSLLQKKS